MTKRAETGLDIWYDRCIALANVHSTGECITTLKIGKLFSTIPLASIAAAVEVADTTPEPFKVALPKFLKCLPPVSGVITLAHLARAAGWKAKYPTEEEITFPYIFGGFGLDPLQEMLNESQIEHLKTRGWTFAPCEPSPISARKDTRCPVEKLKGPSDVPNHPDLVTIEKFVKWINETDLMLNSAKRRAIKMLLVHVVGNIRLPKNLLDCSTTGMNRKLVDALQRRYVAIEEDYGKSALTWINITRKLASGQELAILPGSDPKMRRVDDLDDFFFNYVKIEPGQKVLTPGQLALLSMVGWKLVCHQLFAIKSVFDGKDYPSREYFAQWVAKGEPFM